MARAVFHWQISGAIWASGPDDLFCRQGDMSSGRLQSEPVGAAGDAVVSAAGIASATQMLLTQTSMLRRRHIGIAAANEAFWC